MVLGRDGQSEGGIATCSDRRTVCVGLNCVGAECIDAVGVEENSQTGEVVAGANNVGCSITVDIACNQGPVVCADRVFNGVKERSVTLAEEYTRCAVFRIDINKI